MELFDEKTDSFIIKFPNPSSWEISMLEKCFNNLDTFIEMMQYSYDNMANIHWVNANNVKIKKLERGNEKQYQEHK